jgi:aminomethyltransferase
MRTLPLRAFMAGKGASFVDRFGVEIASAFSDAKTEYQMIRDRVGITDFSSMYKFRIPADTGVDFLDAVFAGNVAKTRFCRVLHTFMADEQGNIIADCYVVNNDEDFIVLCDSIVDGTVLNELFNKNGAVLAGLQDLTDTHILISIDGYKAWAVVKELFGTDVLGLPYLSIETYPFEGENISLLRAGKTSEFGYMIMAPKELGSRLIEVLIDTAQKYQGGLCGISVHDTLRLEGRFFNIFAEGVRVKNPLTLGLQWMIDFDKENFIGREQILRNRQKGLVHKIIGIKTDGLVSDFIPGAELFSEGKKVAVIQACCFSQVLDSCLGLAVFPVGIAYAGLKFNLAKPEGPIVESISMPPIVPKSLSVKLDEL